MKVVRYIKLQPCIILYNASPRSWLLMQIKFMRRGNTDTLKLTCRYVTECPAQV